MQKLIEELRKKRILSRENFRKLLTTDEYDSSLFESADKMYISVVL